MLYLDTSLLVTAFTPEATTPEAQRWLAAQDVDRLLVSDWVLTEFSAALSMKVRTGQLGLNERAAVLVHFRRLVDESLNLVTVGRQHFAQAARLCDQADMGLQAGDALHLAITADLGATLCTRDRRLAEAARQLGIAVLAL